ncbi:hypothetical protein CTAYLR_007804 [Chrysophaeum taylorii]|uniref:Uncharacterized protein n=1 Tax=Chrysophaeum taylorii TaxID=2483200 RepID=A0AAD7UJ06_9STRA|nr:hypothetical protein CTAYLR_007804 [Chrysophaeum taylorii]
MDVEARLSEAEVAGLMTAGRVKKFLKAKCGECGAQGFKKYNKTSPVVLRAQISSFWCKECSRLLCEKHRNLHKCERVDAARQAARRMTGEEIRERARIAEARRVEQETLEAERKRRENEAKAARHYLWKSRRKLVAGRSTHVANFAQRSALQAPPGRDRERLLEIYASCNRINLHLWNEVEAPTTPEAIDDQAYSKLRAHYAEASEITGMVVTVDGLPLDLNLDWIPSAEPTLAPGPA